MRSGILGQSSIGHIGRIVVATILVSSCSTPAPAPSAEPQPLPEPPPVPIPASAAGATTWVEGVGALRGELTIGETFATLHDFEVAISDAVTRIDVPPETRGSLGPVDPNQRLEDEDPWVFIVQTLEYEGTASRAGQQDLILLVRNAVGWSVGAVWSRDLCHQETTGDTCL